MNEVKIAVTIAALLITGAFGSYAFKNLDTDDIVTDKITTVETVEEDVFEDESDVEDSTEDNDDEEDDAEAVEETDTAEDEQAKQIYLERSQSSIRSKVVHIESDDCVYADEALAVETQQVAEPEIKLEPAASKAEITESDPSEAQTPVSDDSEDSRADDREDIPLWYEGFNADVADIWSDDSSVAEDMSSVEESLVSESESSEDESEPDYEDNDDPAEDEDSSYNENSADSDIDESEEENADSVGESESTEKTDTAEENAAEENDGDVTESDEAVGEDEAAEEGSSEGEDVSQDEEAPTEEPEEEPASSTGMTVSQSEYYMLCNVVAHEYGSDWVSEYEKALVVEVIMNRVNSPRYPNSIYEVLVQPYQFSGMESYITLGGFSSQVTQSVKAAVDLYLSDPSQFNHGYYSFWGDGRQNHFY